MAFAHTYEQAQSLLVQCRKTEIAFSNRSGRETMKRSHRREAAAGSNSNNDNTPNNTEAGGRPPFRTALQWAAGCEELLAVLRLLPRSPPLRLDKGEAQFLYGAASLASAGSRRSTSPRAVDAAAASDLWRALANFALSSATLRAAKITQLQIVKRVSPGVVGEKTRDHARSMAQRAMTVLKKLRIAERRASKVRRCGVQ